MIKLIASKAACFLCKDENCKDNYDLYEYAVYIVLSSAFHIVTIVALGLYFNLLVESLLFYFSFVAIRKFAGGYHAKTQMRCYLFSVVSNIIVLLTTKSIGGNMNENIICYIILTIELMCVVFISIVSPLDTNNNPLNDREKKVYKTISKCISLIMFLLSVLFLYTDLKSKGVAIAFGIFMSTFVLLIRKLQVKKLSCEKQIN